MVNITPNAGSERLAVDLPEDGAYPARLQSIVHQGTSEGKFGPQTQCIMRFELPTEKAIFTEGGEEQSHYVNVYVSVSYSEKGAFFQVLNKLGIDTKKPFQLEDALGKACQVEVFSKKSGDKNYLNAKWKGISKIMKGMEVDELSGETKLFWFHAEYVTEQDGVDDDGKPKYVKKGCKNVSMEGYDLLNEWEQEKINSSWEYVELTAGKADEDIGDIDEDDDF